MNAQKPLLYLAPLAITLLVLTSCSSSGAADPASEPGAAEPLAITIEAHDIRYEPSTMEVPLGQPVQLTFANHGELEHDLSFETLPIAEGQAMVMAEGSSHEHEEEAEHGHEEDDEHSEAEQGSHEHEADASSHDEASGGEGSHAPGDAAMHAHTAAGETVTVTFTPTEPGTYEFYCTVPGHREAGMIGTLVVTDS